MFNLTLSSAWHASRRARDPRTRSSRFVGAVLPLAAVILTLAPSFDAEAASDANWDEATLYEGYGADLEWRADVSALKPEEMPVILTFTVPSDGRCRMNLMLPDLGGGSRGARLPTKVLLGVLSRPDSGTEWSHALKAVALRHSQELTFPCRGGDQLRVYAVANQDRAMGVLPGQPVRLNMDVFLLTSRVKPAAATPGGMDGDSLDDLLREHQLEKPSPSAETIQRYMARFASPEFRDTTSYHGAVPLAPVRGVGDRVGLVFSWYSRRVTMGETKSEGFVCQLAVLSEKDWTTELTGGQELGFAPTREAALAAARQKLAPMLRK